MVCFISPFAGILDVWCGVGIQTHVDIRQFNLSPTRLTIRPRDAIYLTPNSK
jgi:hypothetical protein